MYEYMLIFIHIYTEREAQRERERDAPSNESPPHCRANMAHIRQSRPDSGLGVSHLSGGKSSTKICCSLFALTLMMTSPDLLELDTHHTVDYDHFIRSQLASRN